MLREELAAQAKNEAEMIRKEAQEEARAIVHKAQEQQQQKREQARRDYEKEKEGLDSSRYAKAQARAKKRSLEAQAQAISELKTRVQEELYKEETCKKLYTMARKVVEPKKVYCSKDCKAALEKIAKNVTTADIDGIRLENENESVTISLKDLIKQVIEEKEEKITRSLRAL